MNFSILPFSFVNFGVKLMKKTIIEDKINKMLDGGFCNE